MGRAGRSVRLRASPRFLGLYSCGTVAYFFASMDVMNGLMAVWGMSGGELVLIAVALIILFGARKIPEFAKGLGQGIREFKKASREPGEPKV